MCLQLGYVDALFHNKVFFNLLYLCVTLTTGLPAIQTNTREQHHHKLSTHLHINSGLIVYV